MFICLIYCGWGGTGWCQKKFFRSQFVLPTRLVSRSELRPSGSVVVSLASWASSQSPITALLFHHLPNTSNLKIAWKLLSDPFYHEKQFSSVFLCPGDRYFCSDLTCGLQIWTRSERISPGLTGKTASKLGLGPRQGLGTDYSSEDGRISQGGSNKWEFIAS